MIIVSLIIGLLISLGIIISTFILIRILLKKIETYERWILEFKQACIDTHATMKAIDLKGTFATGVSDKGTFESDDQVGQVFKELYDLIEKLNQRTQ